MTLFELIEWLKSQPQDKVIKHGFGEPDSYRGDYCPSGVGSQLN